MKARVNRTAARRNPARHTDPHRRTARLEAIPARFFPIIVAGTLVLVGDVVDPAAGGAGARDVWVHALVAGAERGELEPVEGLQLLRRLAVSTDPAVRARVAEAAANVAARDPEGGSALLRELARDPAGEVRDAVTRGLAQLLGHASPRLRAAVESEWTSAGDAGARVALARALARLEPDWLTDIAIAELAADRRARVRRAALHAAAALLPRDLEAYAQVGLALAGDPDRGARKTARRLLRRAQKEGAALALCASPARQRESRRRFRQALRGERGAPRTARQVSALA